MARRGRGMAVPYDEQRGVHAQSEDFTQHAEWDFEGTPPEHYPLLLHYPYFEIYRKQVDQAGRPGAGAAPARGRLHPRGEGRNFAYYEARTTRDSSLSAASRRSSPRRPATSSWPTTTGPRPR